MICNESCAIYRLMQDAHSWDEAEDEPQMSAQSEEVSDETRICDVLGCNVTVGGLKRFMLSGGSDLPRQELDDAAASDCVLPEIPHQMDVDLGSYPNDPHSPLNQ